MLVARTGSRGIGTRHKALRSRLLIPEPKEGHHHLGLKHTAKAIIFACNVRELRLKTTTASS